MQTKRTGMILRDELYDMRELVRLHELDHRWLYLSTDLPAYGPWDVAELWHLRSMHDPSRSLSIACLLEPLRPGFIHALCPMDEPGAAWPPRRLPRLRWPITESWRQEEVAFLAGLHWSLAMVPEDPAFPSPQHLPVGAIATSSAWAAAGDLRAMLRAVGGCIPQRKLRLLACAFCRLVWQDTRDRRGLRAIEAAERYADGLATYSELDAAARAARGLPKVVAGAGVANALAVAAEHADSEDLCHLVREVLGDPFVEVPIDPAWLRWNDGCVEKMVRTIWRGQRFAELPILADALEDAGCDAEPLLRHFRAPTAHVRGCWGLDLLLARVAPATR
jgi:hypothetical protein